MKKLNSLLHDDKVQGAVIVTAIFLAVALIAFLTMDN